MPIEGNDAICFDSSLPTSLRLMLDWTAAGARSQEAKRAANNAFPKKGECPWCELRSRRCL
jgi:hypothetical protein